jgi:hypothetical protein
VSVAARAVRSPPAWVVVKVTAFAAVRLALRPAVGVANWVEPPLVVATSRSA